MLEPRGDLRADIRVSHQTSAIGNLIASAVGSKNVRFKPGDFLLEFKQQEEIEGAPDAARDFAALREMFGLR